MIRGVTSTEPGAIPDQKNPLKAAVAGGKDGKAMKELEKVAHQFESILTNMMLKSMRSSIQKNGYFDGGYAEDVWTGLLDQNLSSVASTHGHGFGLADKIVKHYAKFAK